MESLELKILRTDRDAKKYYVDYNGVPWQVKQVPEQYGENPPEKIDCIVKTTQYGTYIEQNYITLIKKHYDVGQEQIFNIIRANKDNYELQDDWGYTAYAERVFNIDTVITPKVRCKVKAISSKHPTVEILEALPMETDGLTLHKESIKRIMGIDDNSHDGLLNLMLKDISSELYDLKCMDWASQNIPAVKANPDLLKRITDFCTTFLEDTEYLKNLGKSERYILSNRLVIIIENVAYYQKALDMLSNNQAEAYIQSTLDKLTTSGCLVHPRERIHTMMYIFLLKNELMQQFSTALFDTIRSKDMEFWQEEKLASEWMALLEYYCRFLNTIAASNPDHKANIIQALSLQQGLADDNTIDIFDDRLCRSMLYRYASDMEVQKPKQMLDIAFKNLVGITDMNLSNDICRIPDSKRLANILFNQYITTMDATLTPTQYKGDKAMVVITADGIAITPTETDLSTTDNALSATMNLWRNLQVRVPNRIKEKVTDSITRTASIWNEIDQQLFSRDSAIAKAKATKKYYSAGDNVSFIVRKQLNDKTFLCDILEDGEITDQGILSVDTIVKYHVPGISVNTFRTPIGDYKILPGKVLHQDYQGKYVISMHDHVLDEIRRRHEEDWEQDNDYSILCRVHHYNEKVGRYVGVDEYGFSVSIKVIDEKEPWSNFSKGSIIEAGYPDRNLINEFIQCEFVSTDNTPMPSSVDCFARLMSLCCNENYYKLHTEEVISQQAENMHPMPAEHVEELIAIIEQQATFENDYLKAYNYFGICRTMAKIIGSDTKVDYYDNRMRMIQMLYRFNDTGNIDTAELNRIEQENPSVFSRHSQLQHTLYQLKLVSCLNRPDLFSYLTQLRGSANDESLVRLAKLVMAHNLLKEEGITKEAESIYQQILDLLRLQRNVSNKKYYGEESQYVEFKPSIVFPPDEGMQPNLRKQTQEILMQICAFLNSGGGTLYIGVLDSGYECGLTQDLITAFNSNRDNLMVYLNNRIHSELGAVAARFLDIHWDTDAECDVVVVHIKDCNQIISLSGEYYERRGSSVRRVDDKENFRHFRQQQIQTRTDKHEYKQSYQSPIIQTKETLAEQPQTAPKPSSANTEVIQTSQIRNNVLHNYEDNYLPDVIGYLSFLPNGKYTFHTQDLYDEESKQLVLAIHENEAKGYIICVYDDGLVCKVPIPEILDKTEGNEYNRLTSKRLVFACPATKQDSLMSILTSAKGDKYIRFDEIPTLCDGKMTDPGESLTETSYAEALQFEIVPTAQLSQIKTTFSKRTIGAFTKNGDGQKAKELMESLGVLILS